MKIINITTVLILFLVFIFPAILLLGIKEIPINHQPSLDRTQKIYGDIVVNQSFKAKNNYLSTIGMSIKNPNLYNQEDIILNIYSGGIQQREIVLNGKNIHDGNFVKFKFFPIENSKDQEFTFTLTAPSSKEEKALEIFYAIQDKNQRVYPMEVREGIDVKLKDQEMESKVSFVDFYRPTNAFELIVGVYSRWFGRLAKDTWFFIFYIILMLFGLGYFLKPIISSRFKSV